MIFKISTTLYDQKHQGFDKIMQKEMINFIYQGVHFITSKQIIIILLPPTNPVYYVVSSYFSMFHVLN